MPKDVLPVGTTANAETIRRHLHQVAARTAAEFRTYLANNAGAIP